MCRHFVKRLEKSKRTSVGENLSIKINCVIVKTESHVVDTWLFLKKPQRYLSLSVNRI